MKKEIKDAARQEVDKIKQEAEQAAAYKLKYGAIEKVVSIDAAGGEHVLWLKKPSRLVVGIFMATASENTVQACEYVFNDTVIVDISDVAYFQQDDVFYGILSTLQRLIRVKKSTSMSL
jgi:hypothetical protein